MINGRGIRKGYSTQTRIHREENTYLRILPPVGQEAENQHIEYIRDGVALAAYLIRSLERNVMHPIKYMGRFR